ncbi:transposase [Streptomyces sp. TLI_185]|uniref:transposase n=1 Tax=Streptomyces sp. TLI_185 TaxID=2485151 RepID=UPI0021A2EAF5|nr:transposase [Streptomyces sp. TLI_185]
MTEYRVTGLSPAVIDELIAEVGPLWHEQYQARLKARPRRRDVGAGAKHKFVFVDRLLATLVSLRHGTTHDVLACWFGVDRSTLTRAIGEVRPLLAQRGCTVAPGIRLRTLTAVLDHLGAGGRTGIIDGTEIRARRPAAGRKARDKFVSGKTKQNAVKSMVLTDTEGHVPFCSPVRPGSCAYITQARLPHGPYGAAACRSRQQWPAQHEHDSGQDGRPGDRVTRVVGVQDERRADGDADQGDQTARPVATMLDWLIRHHPSPPTTSSARASVALSAVWTFHLTHQAELCVSPFGAPAHARRVGEKCRRKPPARLPGRRMGRLGIAGHRVCLLCRDAGAHGCLLLGFGGFRRSSRFAGFAALSPPRVSWSRCSWLHSALRGRSWRIAAVWAREVDAPCGSPPVDIRDDDDCLASGAAENRRRPFRFA